MSTLVPTKPKITRLKEDETEPDMGHDFEIKGTFEDVVETCERDFASLPDWDYIACQFGGEGLWYVWQMPKGGHQS